MYKKSKKSASAKALASGRKTHLQLKGAVKKFKAPKLSRISQGKILAGKSGKKLTKSRKKPRAVRPVEKDKKVRAEPKEIKNLAKTEKVGIGAREKIKETYEAKDIYVLQGLEPVRRRPGMYIGSAGPEGLHHLIWECCDNAIDEFLAGYGNEMVLKLLPENRVSVTDNGRGIPVEKHPQTKKSALETVMTTLHAGAKFGGKSYKIAGGLHGVGVSVVCALSSWMRVEVSRAGFKYFQEYSKGKAKTKVKKFAACPKEETGTTVIFEPDPEVFKDIKFDWKKISKHLRQQAYLASGLRMKIIDERSKPKSSYEFYFEGGLASYIKYLNSDEKPIHSNIFYISQEQEGVLVEVALQYTEDIECHEEGFANNIYTGEGGMHLTGFRSAITRVFNDCARKNELLKEKEENLSGDDVREGLTGVVSVKLKDPQFEGQTKAKLGNPEARTAVEAVVSFGLSEFLERNPQDARAIIGKCVMSAKARKAAKAAKDTVLRKGVLEGFALPGKLADCSFRKSEDSEIFIVEGDSAGGSCKMARDRQFQAILPLRGKILNVERARLDKILSNQEIKSLVIALGAAIGDDFDIEKLRYHKIIIMADADSDGNHIKTLLLTLFYRHFKPIIEKGYLYMAQPPLYRIQAGKRMEYVYSDDEKEKIVKEIRGIKKEKKGKGGKKKTKKHKEESAEEKIGGITIQRYKGLGEMNPPELWETTMDPEARTIKQVTIDDAKEADHIFDVLMGDEVAPRKRFIQTYAKKVKNLDI